MYCKDCGKQIVEDSKFCKHCGSEVIAQSAQNTAETENDTQSENQPAPEKSNTVQDKKSPQPEVQKDTTIISPPPLPGSSEAEPEDAPLPPKPTPAEKSAPQANAYIHPQPTAPQPQKTKKHGFLRFLKVIVTILLILPIVAVLTLFIYSAATSNDVSKTNNNVTQSAIESTFDDGDDTAPMITDLTPMSATISTTITFSGSDIDATKLRSVTLNDQQLNIIEVTQSTIKATVTHGAQSGDITLNFVDGQITIKDFEVLPQQKTLILEQEIEPSDDVQTVTTDDISVILPGGAIDIAKTLKIAKIENPQSVNLPLTDNFILYSITLDDVTQFDGILTIVMDLPSDSEGQPSAVYFNETTSLYNTLPSKVIDGKLHIFTTHLTIVGLYDWGTSIVSPDGYFNVYYDKRDTVKYSATMKEFATLVGQTLEDIRKAYESKIPYAYRENFSTINMFGYTFIDSMEVYIDSRLANCVYNPLTNFIHIPTRFSSQEELEITLAHEFFHAYQDAVWNELNFVGTMSSSENRWVVEALAEFAAYEIAYSGKYDRNVYANTLPEDPYDTFNLSHEYNMSCYLRYLMGTMDTITKKPEDLWVSVASGAHDKYEKSVSDFFESRSSSFVSLAESYPEFWMAVLGDSNAPEHYSTFNFVYDWKLSAHEHNAIVDFKPKYDNTISFYMIDITGFKDNVPVRILNMQSTDDSVNGAWSTQIAGVENVNKINGKRIPEGHRWQYTDATTGSYKRFVFEKGMDEVVLVGLDGKTKNQLSAFRFSEIVPKCFPESIEDASVGVEQVFEITFEDVFEGVYSSLLVVDFGDGTIVEFPKENTGSTFAELATHTYDALFDGKVKFMLYDNDTSQKELIAQINVPVTVTNEITLTASPNPTLPAKEVSFSIDEKNADYTYKWSLGDGTTNSKLGLTELTHIYEKPGAYTVSVAVYDELDEHIGTAKLVITVEESLSLSGNWQYLGETYTDFGITYRGVSSVTFYAEGICVMSVGIQSTDTVAMEDTQCTYIYDKSSSSGTIKFKNQETGANESLAFTISGNSLFMAGLEHKKTQ